MTFVGTSIGVVVAGADVSGEFNPKGMSFGFTSLNDPDFGTAHADSNTQKTKS